MSRNKIQTVRDSENGAAVVGALFGFVVANVIWLTIIAFSIGG